MHFCCRVALQFGRRQLTPPANTSMGGIELHNRQNNQSVTEWGQHHATYVQMWMEREGSIDTDMTSSNMRDFKETHLKWLDNRTRYRLRLRPRWTDIDLAEAQQNSDTEDEYDVMVRSTQGAHREYMPMTDRVTYELNKSIIEGSNALMEPEDTLRNTMKRFITRPEASHHAWMRSPCQH